ncbi:unnamed protein product [Euphydryas editha]|uniref:DDE Tnp4 domain-containing protein n=1 Tax=Euphydryas editha TaxID=104508 RepID=A0AAU9UB06_EUPED|nr:unnamed protein product [Euphydryas editha]
MDIVTHWRDSTHDSRIFNEYRLNQRFERSEFKGILLGDAGYACIPFLFTPILNPNTQKEEMKDLLEEQNNNIDDDVPVVQMTSSSLKRNSAQTAFVNENF